MGLVSVEGSMPPQGARCNTRSQFTEAAKRSAVRHPQQREPSSTQASALANAKAAAPAEAVEKRQCCKGGTAGKTGETQGKQWKKAGGGGGGKGGETHQNGADGLGGSRDPVARGSKHVAQKKGDTPLLVRGLLTNLGGNAACSRFHSPNDTGGHGEEAGDDEEENPGTQGHEKLREEGLWHAGRREGGGSRVTGLVHNDLQSPSHVLQDVSPHICVLHWMWPVSAIRHHFTAQTAL